MRLTKTKTKKSKTKKNSATTAWTAAGWCKCTCVHVFASEFCSRTSPSDNFAHDRSWMWHLASTVSESCLLDSDRNRKTDDIMNFRFRFVLFRGTKVHSSEQISIFCANVDKKGPTKLIMQSACKSERSWAVYVNFAHSSNHKATDLLDGIRTTPPWVNNRSWFWRITMS